MSKRIFVGLALVPVLAGCSLFQSAPTPASAPPVVQTVVVERVVTTTPGPSTAVPVVAPTQVAATTARGTNQSGVEFPLYQSVGGIPFPTANMIEADVAPDEIVVITGGPMVAAGKNLPGGETRGSVVLFLPDPAKVIHQKVTDLLPGSNWEGRYRPLASPNSETTWRGLANDRVVAMKVAPNCTPGRGCAIVDVLIVGPSGVVAQWTVQ